MKKQEPFDITTVQNDIEQMLAYEQGPVAYAQPHIRNLLPIVDLVGEIPAYLPVTENAMAVNVASQYEAVAKEVELMGEELKETARRAEAMAAKVKEALKFVAETAAAYRTEASLIFEQIEKVDKLSEAVITACSEMQARIKE